MHMEQKMTHDLLEYKKKKIHNTTLIAFFILAACITWHFEIRDLQLHNAYRSDSPAEYVAIKSHPENFSKGWLTSHTSVIDASFIMRAYFFLADSIGIGPEQSTSPMVMAQCFLLIFTLYHLSQSIYQSRCKSILFVSICLLSPVTSLDLARFSYGVKTMVGPLYYGWSFGFICLAFSFYFRRKIFSGFVFLTLAALCHISMALIAAAFWLPYVFRRPNVLIQRNTLLGLAVFLSICCWHALGILGTNSYGPPMPDDLWINTTKIFCYHWYPSALGIFSHNAHQRFFPLLLMGLLFLTRLFIKKPTTEKEWKLILGVAGGLGLSAFGYITTEVLPVPFLIRISPLRASGLASFFMAMIVIGWLYDELISGKTIQTIMAAWLLTSITIAKPGMAAFPSLALIMSVPTNRAIALKYLKLLAGALLPSLIVVSLINHGAAKNLPWEWLDTVASDLHNNLWSPLTHMMPFTINDLALLGGEIRHPSTLGTFASVLLAALMAIAASQISKHRASPSICLIACLSLTTLIFMDASTRADKWLQNKGPEARALLDAQLWARDNTPPMALFLVEPYRATGWQTYSLRSSFGNLHSWGFVGIGYRPNMNRYREGRERAAAFGINWELQFPDGIARGTLAGNILKKQLRKKLYGMTDAELIKLAERFNIDYIVFNKKYASNQHNIPIVYENSQFIIYSSS